MKSITEIEKKLKAFRRLQREFLDDFKANGDVSNLTLARSFERKAWILEWVLENEV